MQGLGVDRALVHEIRIPAPAGRQLRGDLDERREAVHKAVQRALRGGERHVLPGRPVVLVFEQQGVHLLGADPLRHVGQGAGDVDVDHFALVVGAQDKVLPAAFLRRQPLLFLAEQREVPQAQHGGHRQRPGVEVGAHVGGQRRAAEGRAAGGDRLGLELQLVALEARQAAEIAAVVVGAAKASGYTPGVRRKPAPEGHRQARKLPVVVGHAPVVAGHVAGHPVGQVFRIRGEAFAGRAVGCAVARLE